MLSDTIEIKGGFVRAVKMEDFFDKEINQKKLESYYPNPEARLALYIISRGLHPTSIERAHIVSGTYGSGKSHFALVLANYVTKNSSCEELQTIFNRLRDKDRIKASEIYSIRDTDKPYLMVLIEGYDPDGVEHALLRGLKDAITDTRRGNIPEEKLETYYSAAISKIKSWKEEKPEFYKELQQHLEGSLSDIERLEQELHDLKESALRIFKEMHLKITTSSFEPFLYGGNVAKFYKQLCEYIIRERGYKGIFIIWDQFNDHLMSMPVDRLGKDAAILRDFAEVVERSGENQIHIVLISHKTLHVYLEQRGLGKENLEVWGTVEGRFKYQHTLTAIKEAEELISNIIIKRRETEEWKCIEEQLGKNTKLVDEVIESDLYPSKSREWVNETVLKGTFPLHPFVTYCLPRISDAVGQEYRTMFTFFEEKTKDGGLTKFVNENPAFATDKKLNFYTIDKLFSFFKEGIEQNPETAFIKRNFDEAMKNVRDSNDILTQKLMKSLCVLGSIQTKYSLPLLRTPKHLSIALDAEESKLSELMESLREGNVLWIRSNGEYEFSAGQSRADLEGDFQRELSMIPFDNPILNLKTRYPPNRLLAKEYDKKYHVERKLIGEYINADGLSNLSRIETRIKDSYEDGFILYVVAKNESEIKEARKYAVNIKNSQIVIAIPKEPLGIYEPLKSLEAISQLKEKPPYNRDGEEARTRLRDKESSEVNKLTKAIETYQNPAKLELFWEGKTIASNTIKQMEDVASIIMEKVFCRTPIVEHRKMANMEEHDHQRADRIKLNTAILDTSKEEIEYISKGRVPAEKTIIEQTLQHQGMFTKRSVGNYDYYKLIEPKNENMKEVWGIMKKHLMKPQPDLKKMMQDLRSPPYGISPRVIEIFLATLFKFYRPRFVIKTKRTKGADWELRDFTGQTVYEVINERDFDKVSIEYREQLKHEPEYLGIIYKSVCKPKKMPELKSLDTNETGKKFVEWFQAIPTVAKSSPEISNEAKSLVNGCGGIGYKNLREFLLDELPNILNAEKKFDHWDNSDIKSFESKFEAIVTELESYTERVKSKVKNMFKGVFDIKSDTDESVIAAIGDWYGELPSHVKEYTKFERDEMILMKHANIKSSPDFERTFIEDMPKDLGLDSYKEWEDIDGAIEDYRSRLVAAKKKVESIQKYVKKKSPKEDEERQQSKYAITLEKNLRDTIRHTGASKTEIIEILTKLLNELQ